MKQATKVMAGALLVGAMLAGWLLSHGHSAPHRSPGAQRRPTRPTWARGILPEERWTDHDAYGWQDERTLICAAFHLAEPGMFGPADAHPDHAPLPCLARLTVSPPSRAEYEVRISGPCALNYGYPLPWSTPRVSVSPNGRWLVSLPTDIPRVRLIDVAAARPSTREVPALPHTSGEVAWSADSSRFALFSADTAQPDGPTARVTITDTRTGRQTTGQAPRAAWERTPFPRSLVMRDDHTLVVATTGDDRCIQRLSADLLTPAAPTRRQSWSVPAGRQVGQLTLSPDGQRLLYTLVPEGGIELGQIGTETVEWAARWPQTVELWMAGADGASPRMLGRVDIDGLGHIPERSLAPEGLRWRPDGQSASFVWQGTLYVVQLPRAAGAPHP